jgi:4'-phosphopantetheinyl transferase EntD
MTISNLLPFGVVSVQQEEGFSGSLSPEEEKALGGVVLKRRMEFTAGRTCARSALERLGTPVSSLLRGPAREPLWPSGVVGSITHCEGYCAAAVSYQERFAGIGIDAEVNEPLPEGTLELVARPEELERLGRLPAGSLCWDRLLFSIKESVYKTWYPLTKSWLGFEEASVTIDSDRQTFQVDLLIRNYPEVLSPLRGRYLVEGRHILTAIVLAGGASSGNLQERVFQG